MDDLIKNALLDKEFPYEAYRKGNKTFLHRLNEALTLSDCDYIEGKWSIYRSIYKRRLDNAQDTTVSTQESLHDASPNERATLGNRALHAAND